MSPKILQKSEGGGREGRLERRLLSMSSQPCSLYQGERVGVGRGEILNKRRQITGKKCLHACTSGFTNCYVCNQEDVQSSNLVFALDNFSIIQ